jgi:hypothetical protein
MNKAIAIGTALMLCAGVVLADSRVPIYNATGVWRSAGGGTAEMFQEAKKVSMIFVGPDYAHNFEGTYTTPTTFEGTVVRVTRATGCTTYMQVTFTVASRDLINVNAAALDSNCDLVKDQVYTDVNYRTY